MDKVCIINGGMFTDYRIIFADRNIARRALRAYANFLEFRGFGVHFTGDDRFTFGDDCEAVWIGELSTAHELPSFLENFTTD